MYILKSYFDTFYWRCIKHSHNISSDNIYILIFLENHDKSKQAYLRLIILLPCCVVTRNFRSSLYHNTANTVFNKDNTTALTFFHHWLLNTIYPTIKRLRLPLPSVLVKPLFRAIEPWSVLLKFLPLLFSLNSGGHLQWRCSVFYRLLTEQKTNRRPLKITFKLRSKYMGEVLTKLTTARCPGTTIWPLPYHYFPKLL